MAGIKVGDRVHVAGFGASGNTATVVEVLDRCPKAGCYKPALRVRRDPGCFPTWGSDEGLWHQEDAVVVPAGGESR